jgi:drug/metabolite transporter (DMT)-like permease
MAKRNRSQLARRMAIGRYRLGRLPPTVEGLLWAVAAGFSFTQLNTLARYLTAQLPAFESQFLRYLMGFLVMLPLVWRAGLPAYRPRHIGGQFIRGIVHTAGLGLWFIALPHIPLADMTAIGFTTPIFIMLGAWLVFRESMRWERWLAALVGFSGVLVVVGPKLAGDGGHYNLIMLASAPVFAASFLITKALTRYERPEVIVVWQSLTITVLSLPLALMDWHAPTPGQWLGFLVCGVLGSAAHYCLTCAYGVTDISATQSVKFLDLVWASLMGWLVFADAPSQTTLLGGLLILASTVWIARREGQRRKA